MVLARDLNWIKVKGSIDLKFKSSLLKHTVAKYLSALKEASQAKKPQGKTLLNGLKRVKIALKLSQERHQNLALIKILLN